MENQASDLALDIDATKGGCFCVLEEANSFAGQEMDVRAPLLEEMLAAVVDNELCGILIVAKSEFISNHSNFNIWLIPVHNYISKAANDEGTSKDDGYSRFANIAQCSKALTSHKFIHEITTQDGRVLVKLEETVVVAQSQCRANV